MTTTTALVIASVVALLAVVLLVAIIVRKGKPFTTATCSGPAGGAAETACSRPGDGLADLGGALHAAVGRTARAHDPHRPRRVSPDRHELFFSDIFIETSGGVSPISCYGHHKKDAVRIRR